jgi:hypothetical protein
MFRYRDRFAKFLIIFVVGAMVLSLIGGVLLTVFNGG